MLDPSDGQNSPGGCSEQGALRTEQAVVISLRIDPGEPITGSLTNDSGFGVTPFCGWMELISAISSLRDGHKD